MRGKSPQKATLMIAKCSASSGVHQLTSTFDIQMSRHGTLPASPHRVLDGETLLGPYHLDRDQPSLTTVHLLRLKRWIKSFNYTRTMYQVKDQIYTRAPSLLVLSLKPNLGPHCNVDKLQMVECSPPKLLLSRSTPHPTVRRPIICFYLLRQACRPSYVKLESST